MDIKSFFEKEENIKKFCSAKTEEEARKILETECGKVSDGDFEKIKKGLDDLEAILNKKISSLLDEKFLENVSGGSLEGRKNAWKRDLILAGLAVGMMTPFFVGVAIEYASK